MLRLDLNLVWTIVNLIILYLLMKRFLWGPVKNIIAQRQQEADEAFAKAQDSMQQTEQQREKYEKSMQEIEGLKEQETAKARQSASVEYQKLMEDAQKKANTLIEETRIKAEQEKKQIIKEAETEIADLVMEMTAKIAVSKDGLQDDKALYDQFISQMRKDM